ncbi:tryptophan 2,3-dioxygenase family protein [Methylocaldum sp.]|uniref:tryptophan 2,3-dioxygenase family protein n=1 Tax=Methylocaldum sp. TaxID=1969727 RepID=UPI002D403352|nr:tryptophan 2,3-dioxygenase family protein [Methylocaldum sp.]HYE37714.1 tryptophan 2,3-dioxygenase family protein [Methylocaldum sp.]
MRESREGLHYSDYLRLDMLLNAQFPESGRDDREVHDETLFIIAHQVHELWFKEILHELKSVLELFSSCPSDERKIGLIATRLGRLVAIQKIINRQIDVLETISPLDFLDFRDYLFSDSVFQSSQFREIELRLGLAMQVPPESFNRFRPEEREVLRKASEEKSLFEAVDDWLVNMPFRSLEEVEFWPSYRRIVHDMLQRDYQLVQNRRLSAWERQSQLSKLENARYRFDALFKPDEFEVLRDDGLFQLRRAAVLSALFILLYRDEPILQVPFRVLKRLMDVDDQLIGWRINRTLFEQRMLGNKVGAGGSITHDYVREMMEEKRIFRDLFILSTFLVPHSSLPVLPQKFKQSLDIYFNNRSVG